MPEIKISEARLSSLPALRRMLARAVTEHFAYFPQEVQRRVISDHTVPKLLLASVDRRRIVLTAHAGNRLIGYCLGSTPRSGAAQIYWLFVEPDQRGRNTGLSLLSRMLKIMEQKGARQVAIATHDHRRYYERQGFKYEGTRTVNGVTMDILTFNISGYET
jgi:ribosomal protein S18 acetylase RimI-like enzyme